MPIQPPRAAMANPPDAEYMFRLQGKTISIVTLGQATVLTLTFDDIGVSSTASGSGAVSPIAIPGGRWWSFRRRAPVVTPLLP